MVMPMSGFFCINKRIHLLGRRKTQMRRDFKKEYFFYLYLRKSASNKI